MLPVARKPIVQYVVEELAANGVHDMLFVTGRNKASIENHFDSDPELFRALDATNKTDLLQEVLFEELNANFFYTRQRKQQGLGDAVLCGENFAGEQPFVVALGDSILGLHARSKAVARMADLFEARHASCVVAVEEVPPEETSHYGIVQIADETGDCMRVLNLVEKPGRRSGAKQPGHRRPLRFLAPGLRPDPPREARPQRRDPAHRRHPAHVRGRQARAGL